MADDAATTWSPPSVLSSNVAFSTNVENMLFTEGFSYHRCLSAGNRVIGGDHSMGSERGKAVSMLVSPTLGGQVDW